MKAGQAAKAICELSDVELTSAVADLARSAREVTAGLVGHLVEFENRRLHLAAGYGSLFVYCVQVLRLSEHEAYNRIEAARVARKHPAILDMLATGDLNLTSVRLLAPHLTDANHLVLLREAAGKSKRQVLEVIAGHFPRPDVAATVRKVPMRHDAPTGPIAPLLKGSGELAMAPSLSCSSAEVSCGSGSSADPSCRVGPDPADVNAGMMALPMAIAAPPKRQDTVLPLAPNRYEVRFTASAETCEKLKLAKNLLRHVNPAGDTADIVDRALTLLLADLARKKFADTRRPRPSRDCAGERHIPAAVKRAVWLRDMGRCAFVGKGQHRCEARGFLEFHHVRPYAVGGEATVENIQLRCRAHNGYEADLFFGRLVPERVEGGTSLPRGTLSEPLAERVVGGAGSS